MKRQKHPSSSAAIKAALPSPSNENNNNIYQTTDPNVLRERIVQKFVDIQSQLPQAFPPLEELQQKKEAVISSTAIYDDYLQKLEDLRAGRTANRKLIIKNENGEQELAYSTANLITLLDRSRKEAEKKSVKLDDATVSKEDKRRYIEALTYPLAVNHYLDEYITLYDKEASKQYRNVREDLFRSLIFIINQLGFINESASSASFAKSFFTLHRLTKADINVEYISAVQIYIATTLYHVYVKNTEVVTQQEDTIGVNFIQLAIQLYNFSNAKQIESESLNNEDGGNVWPNHMMLGALYQAVYSYNYSFVMKDKKDQAGWAYRNRHIELAADALGRVNTKAYWSKKLITLGLVKIAFRAYKKIKDKDKMSQQILSLMIEMTVKILGELNNSVAKANDLTFKERRDYYKFILANLSFLTELMNFAQNDINKNYGGLAYAYIEELTLYYKKLLEVLDQEFITRIEESKKSAQSLLEDELRGTEETQENVKGEKIQKARNLRLPKQDSTADSMPLEKAASVEISSLQSNFEINFNYALSFLLEKQHDKAIESFRDLYEKSKKKPGIKTKSAIALAECHAIIAGRGLKEKPLSYCFNHKIPVTNEVRNKINSIVDHIHKAFDYCENAKDLIVTLPMVEKNNLLACIEMVLSFVSKAFKELGKERERYLENMEQLKKRLIDAGLYGPNIVRDPQHLTANGVAWCKRTGSALGAFVSLISEIEEEIEGSYVVQLYQSNATTVLQKLNNLKRNFEGINLTSKTDKELCLLAEIKQKLDQGLDPKEQLDQLDDLQRQPDEPVVPDNKKLSTLKKTTKKPVDDSNPEKQQSNKPTPQPQQRLWSSLGVDQVKSRQHMEPYKKFEQSVESREKLKQLSQEWNELVKLQEFLIKIGNRYTIENPPIAKSMYRFFSDKLENDNSRKTILKKPSQEVREQERQENEEKLKDFDC